MKRIFLALMSLALVSASGCANFKPDEPTISVQIPATADQVQKFIDTRFKNNGFEYVTTDKDVAVYRVPCRSIPGQSDLSCTLIMSRVGTAGWDGPYLYVAVKRSELNKTTTVAAKAMWCAIHIMGQTNCEPIRNDIANEITRGIGTNWNSY